MSWRNVIPQVETVAEIIRTAALWIGLICVGIAGTLAWMVTRADFERGLSYRATQVVERVMTK